MTTSQTKTLLLATGLLLAVALPARSQAFSSGSDGSDGELLVAEGQTVAVALPPDGILRYTNVTVSPGATLTFTRNARNTPVYVLSQGPIVVDGTIDVGGSVGTQVARGLGGPGGFDGGDPGAGTEPGDGFGPGGGGGGTEFLQNTFAVAVGSGAYQTRVGVFVGGEDTRFQTTPTPLTGSTYGSALLVPLVGGSGGGGCASGPGVTGSGGNGGGGAILLASDVSVTVAFGARVVASGAPFPRLTEFNDGVGTGGLGSGGAIRLVAPQVLGSGELLAPGGALIFAHANRNEDDLTVKGGLGRIRIDTLDRGALEVRSFPSAVVGSLMLAIPLVVQRLDIVHVAGQDIALDSGPVLIVLPEVAPAVQPVTIRATGFTGILPIRLRLVPESGMATITDLEIDMSGGDPAELEVNATFPPNVRTRVEVFTR